jgi:molybdate transport system substrate-binding protein
MFRHVRATAALLAIAVVLLAGCGDPVAPTNQGRSGDVLVSAAASLKGPFTAYGETLTDFTVRFSFAGSDELAAQIRSGAKPDVFASADAKLLEELNAKGLVEEPRPFATNRLVLAVPEKGSKVDSLDDLARPGVKLAIGSRSVPVGAYTRAVLDRLGADRRRRILANVRSQEPDVGGVTAKLTQGAVDAGFVYVSDVVATDGRLKAIALPRGLQPDIEYAAAVVEGAQHAEQARRFVDGLLRGRGAAALQAAGFRSVGR